MAPLLRRHSVSAAIAGDSILLFSQWAGGKRWLALHYAHLFPRKFDRYLEPFVGGGSVFFSLRPSRSILSDSNERLMECYRELRGNPAGFAKLMRQHQQRHSDDYYYSLRDKILRKPLTRAAQFLYLNRTC
jgi:DNA adenine methylase